MRAGRQPLSYRRAGVDIDAGTRLVERIGDAAAATRRAGCLGGLGGFAGLFDLGALGYRQPLLVAATDGVGTKLQPALAAGRYHTLGTDLVAMCVNDVVVQGAEPLFFLDYLACDHLEVETAAALVEGIAQACRTAGAALIGGESAEMPGCYPPGGYDLAGFCVGVVERERLLDGSRPRIGDALLGLASSGPHANGYSLIRKVMERAGVQANADNATVEPLRSLLAPTRIYVPAVLALLRAVEVAALAHVTGGGLPENLPRVLPAGLGAVIHTDSWQLPEVFAWLQREGDIATAEMFRVFNCGVGMVACVPRGQVSAALDCLHAQDEQAWLLGEVVAHDTGPRVRLR